MRRAKGFAYAWRAGTETRPKGLRWRHLDPGAVFALGKFLGKGGRGLFERFTERARQVVVLAQDEARALKHNYIGTEHILLGLLREEEGLAARVLESLD